MIVVMKSTILWDITPFSLLKINPRFKWIYRLHLHSLKISQARCQHESKWQGESPCFASLLATFHADTLLGLLFSPEDGGDMFLWKVGRLSTDYTALYPRRQSSSLCNKFGSQMNEWIKNSLFSTKQKSFLILFFF
jgi:hypothetical protein